MRRGLTLLELLLATSMFVILMGIVASLTLTLARMETQRAHHAAQQRMERKWLRILNQDFQSIIQDTEQLNRTVGTETIRHFGVSGTATQLRIDISDYSWRTADSSELRTIFYEFHPTSGFTRRERDYAALKSAEGALQTAPEIVNGTFRYFDGGTWHEHWASLDRKSVPRAIEVTFYSLPLTEANRWRNRAADAREPVLSRVRIPIPAASPSHETYRRAQAPRPPQESLPPPPPPSPPPPPQTPAPPPPSPFHSLFGDD